METPRCPTADRCADWHLKSAAVISAPPGRDFHSTLTFLLQEAAFDTLSLWASRIFIHSCEIYLFWLHWGANWLKRHTCSHVMSKELKTAAQTDHFNQRLKRAVKLCWLLCRNHSHIRKYIRRGLQSSCLHFTLLICTPLWWVSKKNLWNCNPSI